MNANPLEQLHDISELQSVHWWPLGIGWWLLLSVLVIAVAIVFVHLRRRKHKLKLLKSCIGTVQSANDIAHISIGLRVAIRAYSTNHEIILLSSGVQFITQLNQQLPAAQQLSEQSCSELGQALYQRSAPEHIEQYRNFALRWLQATGALKHV
ncbi:DUF4381 domain-containing protein [Aliidiomarina celeris]|uniref:DUF4381 domain-containing protein n=1 Tax=Aliidiomarina celeris TaxID=2249428 RepID=UPI0013001AAB|nr:DUF4381 domain-containing protein [Aliidiomarina celeris]